MSRIILSRAGIFLVGLSIFLLAKDASGTPAKPKGNSTAAHKGLPISLPELPKGLPELPIRIRRNPKPPKVAAAPLDPNDNVHHTLDEVSSILGTVGGAGSGAVMGLTGISVSDCALTIKDEDLSKMTCAQFLNKLSKCDSMAHVKPLLHQAKQKHKKSPNSKEPCFTNAKKGKGKKGRKGK